MKCKLVWSLQQNTFSSLSQIEANRPPNVRQCLMLQFKVDQLTFIFMKKIRKRHGKDCRKWRQNLEKAKLDLFNELLSVGFGNFNDQARKVYRIESKTIEI